MFLFTLSNRLCLVTPGEKLHSLAKKKTFALTHAYSWCIGRIKVETDLSNVMECHGFVW